MNTNNNKHLAMAIPHLGAAFINDLVGNSQDLHMDWSIAEHQLKIILSEVDELKTAVYSRNYNEYRDGINDVRFTVDGAAHRNGIEVIDDFSELMRSQLSKFDLTKEDAIKTVEAYSSKGVVTSIYPTEHQGVTYYVVKASVDQTVDGRFIPAGKFLKSHNFSNPVYKLREHQRALGPVVVDGGDTAMIPQYRQLTDTILSIAQIRVGDGNITLHKWFVINQTPELISVHQENCQGDSTQILQMWHESGDMMIRNHTGMTLHLDLIADVSNCKQHLITKDRVIFEVPLE
jgi:hypothetical protein